jgi:hypothetical protein
MMWILVKLKMNAWKWKGKDTKNKLLAQRLYPFILSVKRVCKFQRFKNRITLVRNQHSARMTHLNSFIYVLIAQMLQLPSYMPFSHFSYT